MAANDTTTTHENRDPITDAPGAHPLGTGLGATGGAIAGAAAGALGGPIGAAAGGVAGAVAGGLAGKAAAESVNPTDEEAYWRNQYMRESYYETGRTYDDYGPAYALGWNYRSRYDSDFDSYESQLATDWERVRGNSKLTWPQGRLASRAAWDRIGGKRFSGGADNGDTIDTIDTLNDLIETCGDGEYGFNACAEHTSGVKLTTVFRHRAEQCREAAAELRGLVQRLGGKPDEGGTASGALHRGWVAVRGTLAGYSDQAMLDECERAEDTALARYRKALKQTLPSDIQAVVQRQMDGAQRNHDQIKALRDNAKSLA